LILNFQQPLQFIYDYQHTHFSLNLVQQLNRHFQHFLTWSQANPTSTLNNFCLLTHDEIQKQLNAHLTNKLSFPQTGILDWLNTHAQNSPHKKAVTCHGQSLTYKKLAQSTDTLAGKILTLLSPLKKNQNLRIALCMSASIAEIQMILAILKINA